MRINKRRVGNQVFAVPGGPWTSPIPPCRAQPLHVGGFAAVQGLAAFTPARNGLAVREVLYVRAIVDEDSRASPSPESVLEKPEEPSR